MSHILDDFLSIAVRILRCLRSVARSEPVLLLTLLTVFCQNATASPETNVQAVKTSPDTDVIAAKSSGRNKHTKSIDDYIYMLDRESKIPPWSGEKLAPKPWALEEVNEIRPLLVDILRKYPGLFELAASNGKVKIYRCLVPPGDSKFAIAVSSLDSLFLPNAFFHESRRKKYKYLVHEMVHLADWGGRLAYSNEWVSFANPVASKMRLQLKLGDFNTWNQLYESVTKEERSWPSIYGSTNLREALAEFFAEFAANERFPEGVRPSYDKFAQKLIQPSEQDIQWSKHFKQAMVLVMEKNHLSAIQELEQCISIDPAAPYPYHFLIMEADKSENWTKYSIAAKEGLKVYQSAGVPINEGGRASVTMNCARVTAQCGRLGEAINLLDTILDADPGNEFALESRASIHEYLGHFGQSLDDTYSSFDYKNRDIGLVSLDVRSDPRLAMSLLEWQICSNSYDEQQLRRKAWYLIKLGDASDDPAKGEFYKKAEETIIGCLSKMAYRKDKAFTLLCAVSLKQKRFREAQEYCTKSLQMCPDSLDALIEQMKLWQATGQMDRVRREYPALKQRVTIMKKQFVLRNLMKNLDAVMHDRTPLSCVPPVTPVLPLPGTTSCQLPVLVQCNREVSSIKLLLMLCSDSFQRQSEIITPAIGEATTRAKSEGATATEK